MNKYLSDPWIMPVKSVHVADICAIFNEIAVKEVMSVTLRKGTKAGYTKMHGRKTGGKKRRVSQNKRVKRTRGGY